MSAVDTLAVLNAFAELLKVRQSDASKKRTADEAAIEVLAVAKIAAREEEIVVDAGCVVALLCEEHLRFIFYWLDPLSIIRLILASSHVFRIVQKELTIHGTERRTDLISALVRWVYPYLKEDLCNLRGMSALRLFACLACDKPHWQLDDVLKNNAKNMRHTYMMTYQGDYTAQPRSEKDTMYTYCAVYNNGYGGDDDYAGNIDVVAAPPYEVNVPKHRWNITVQRNTDAQHSTGVLAAVDVHLRKLYVLAYAGDARNGYELHCHRFDYGAFTMPCTNTRACRCNGEKEMSVEDVKADDGRVCLVHYRKTVYALPHAIRGSGEFQWGRMSQHYYVHQVSTRQLVCIDLERETFAYEELPSNSYLVWSPQPADILEKPQALYGVRQRGESEIKWEYPLFMLPNRDGENRIDI